MKIGFSFGRCVRDIVNGEVDIADVVLIIARTKMPDTAQVIEVCHHYMRDSFNGLQLEKCIEVALELYNSGRIHQPRIYGSFGSHIQDKFVWMDLLPTVTDQTPSVTAAWDNYIMLLTLCSNKVKPDLSDIPEIGLGLV